MTDYGRHSRLIARNTVMLYFRMFILMLVGLYASRVVLEALGETDYGVYNVVGGLVAMFTVISGALNSAVSRFITYEIGKGPEARLTDVYSTAVVVQFCLAVIVVVIAEPVGLWFIDNRMTIDPSRVSAARWVFQYSLLSFVVNLMSIPQMAAITAHERMSAYAGIGALDGILRLAAAIAVSRSSYDRLIQYAMLMCLAVIMVRVAYTAYCRRNLPECRFRMVFDWGLIRKMFSFAGWNFIGVSSGVLRDHGGNILVNLFFGPALNAARGVAVQLNGAVQGFVSNFMTAVNPQIIKSYACGQIRYMSELVMISSKMSFCLLWCLSLPVILNTDFLLALWLKDVPAHTTLFVRLFLVFSLSESLSNPFMTSLMATGRIRNYQLIVGGLQLLNLPVSYWLLRAGAEAEVTVVVAIVLSQICLLARLMLCHSQIGFSAVKYLKDVYLRILLVAALSFMPCRLLHGLMPEGLSGFLISVSVSVSVSVLAVWFVGCGREDRRRLWNMFRREDAI